MTPKPAGYTALPPSRVCRLHKTNRGFYEEGLGGLPKNIREATRLYRLAAEQDSNLEAKRQASDALKRLGAATAAVSPSATSNRAQAAMPVIGILNWGFPNRNADYLVAFRQGLAKAGYVEGRNTAIEYRWAICKVSANRRSRWTSSSDVA
jgi:hypothetical protein